MYDNFRVAFRFERMSLFFETLHQGEIIVDLTIKYNPDILCFITHWLFAGSSVDYTESAHSETKRPGNIDAFIIGTTVFHFFHHASHDCFRSSLAVLKIIYAANSAHFINR